MSKPKMLIIDGSSMLATNYYATIPNEIKFAKTDEEKEKHYDKILHAPDGTYTNAIMGMCRMIANIVEEGDFDNIVTVFDKSRKTTFRRKMYPEYKAQRSETPAPLKQQMILIQQILSDAGFPVLMCDEYEADDLAGSVAQKYKENYEVSLMTKDRDYLQLVDDQYGVKCLIMSDNDKASAFRLKYGHKEPEEKFMKSIMDFDAAAVFGEKGVYPVQIPCLKSLEGDTSDNIPGVKGVSETTAAALLRYHGTTAHLYADIDAVKDNKDSLAGLVSVWKEELGIKRSPLKALLAGEESAVMSEKLATIICTVSVPDITKQIVATLNTTAFDDWMTKLAIRNITLKPGGMNLTPEGEGVFYANGSRRDVQFYFDPDNETDDCGIPVEFLLGGEPKTVADEPITSETEKENTEEKVEECAKESQANSEIKPAAQQPEQNSNDDSLVSLKRAVELIQTTDTLSELNENFELASAILVKLFDKHYYRIKEG